MTLESFDLLVIGGAGRGARVRTGPLRHGSHRRRRHRRLVGRKVVIPRSRRSLARRRWAQICAPRPWIRSNAAGFIGSKPLCTLEAIRAARPGGPVGYDARSMSFKPRVSSTLGKDELLEIGRGLEFEVTTRMGVDDLRDALAKSKRANQAAIIQESLPRDTLARAVIKIPLSASPPMSARKPDAKLVLPFRGAAKAE